MMSKVSKMSLSLSLFCFDKSTDDVDDDDDDDEYYYYYYYYYYCRGGGALSTQKRVVFGTSPMVLLQKLFQKSEKGHLKP